MDDFLHNLRSGKLKQQDRGRRDYGDYKGPQRRVSSDRRRTDYYAKVTSENFALVKDTIDGLARQQKRIADALTDLLYVVLGTIVSHGLQDHAEELFTEVHRSNMSKLDSNGEARFRSDGKVIKSDRFFKPDLASILAEYLD